MRSSINREGEELFAVTLVLAAAFFAAFFATFFLPPLAPGIAHLRQMRDFEFTCAYR